MSSLDRLTAALTDRYRLDRELGAGGMATVYLAHDLKHDRDVAIKVLHPDLGAALGGERFLTEIRTTARLQHPHILPLLDSGDADGLLYYVMPLVTGETLRARLERERQLPITDAVLIAREVADALGYAHGLGVIHRDIKPENILLQNGHALVADFGIALAVQSAGGARMTQTGLSLGTPQYKSPEQAMGERTIDARSDIYALGAMTYEMLAGDAPFTGSSVQAIVAKVLSSEPERLSVVRKTIPPHIEGAVLKALAKLPADRWARASDFAAALTDAGVGAVYATRALTAQGVAAASMSGRTRVMLALTTTLAIAGAGSAAWFATRDSQRNAIVPAAARFDVALPDSVKLYSQSGRRLALSRDGTQLVVVATKGNFTGLYLRRMDEAEFRVIPGSERVQYAGNVDLVFSPDGLSLLFRGDTSLLRIPVTGGRAERVGPGAAASWGDGDRIVYITRDTLLETTADGNARRVIRVADSAAKGWQLSWPSVLPGGRQALVTLTPFGEVTNDSRRLGLVSLDDGGVEDLGIIGLNPLYSGTGHIVFGRATGEVFAVPFSLATRKVLGQPTRIMENVWVGPVGAVGVAVSQNGTLTYHLTDAGVGRRWLWNVGVDGSERRVPAAAERYFLPRVSPDGQRAVVENNVEEVSAPSGPISLLDLRTGAVQRLAAPGEGQYPAWTRDGGRVAFLRFLGPRGREIVSRAWDRSDADQLLLRDTSALLFDFRLGPSGAWSVLRTGGMGAETAGQDILLAPAESLSQARPLVATAASEVMPDLSPDGRWLAYASTESGLREIYVQPVPGPGARLQVSITGGGEPLWSPQGGTLFYRSAERLIIAARLEMAPLRVVKYDTLFLDRFVRAQSKTNWSVFPNGKEFLMISGSQDTGGPKAVVNWTQLPAMQRGGSTPR